MKLVHTIDTSPNPHGKSSSALTLTDRRLSHSTGICALSASPDRCYLAYPMPQRSAPSSFSPPSHAPQPSQNLSLTSGHVLIFDALSLQSINVIEAHRAPLSCIAMDSTGTKLATASDKGTIIRVFSIPDAQKLAQFRRGSMPARIFSMAFNATSTLLCVSSATETIHVFKLSDSQSQAVITSDISSEPSSPTQTSQRSRRLSDRSLSPAESDVTETDQGARPASSNSHSTRPHDGTFTGMLRRTSQNVTKTFAATVGGYLPSAVSEMLEPTRDFAWFKLLRAPNTSQGQLSQKGVSGGDGALKSVVAMSNSSPQVMVITSEGNFLVFNIDLESGGEGTLTKQYSILSRGDSKQGRNSIGDD